MRKSEKDDWRWTERVGQKVKHAIAGSTDPFFRFREALTVIPWDNSQEPPQIVWFKSFSVFSRPEGLEEIIHEDLSLCTLQNITCSKAAPLRSTCGYSVQ